MARAKTVFETLFLCCKKNLHTDLTGLHTPVQFYCRCLAKLGSWEEIPKLRIRSGGIVHCSCIRIARSSSWLIMPPQYGYKLKTYPQGEEHYALGLPGRSK